MKEKLSWKTERRKVKDLVAWDKNPRSISEEQKEKLKQSFERFNLVELPAIDKDNKIVAGHQRVMVLKLLGRENEEIEVRVPNRKLTEAEFKEYNLRSNKNTGEFDYELLGKYFEPELLEYVGFSAEEISMAVDFNREIEDDEFDEEKAVAKAKKSPVAKKGDLWILGNHKLLVGDSTDLDDVLRLVGEEKMDAIYCDPPYNIGLNYSKGIGGKKDYSESDVNDSKTDNDYKKFIGDTLRNAIAVSKKDAHVFYWCDENYIWVMQNLFQENGIELRRVCMWIKNNQNPTPQVAFNKVYEPCVYGTIGSPFLNNNFRNLNEVINREARSGNELLDDVERFLNIWPAKRDNAQDYDHPTQKPLNLHEKPIKRCTAPGGGYWIYSAARDPP